MAFRFHSKTLFQLSKLKHIENIFKLNPGRIYFIEVENYYCICLIGIPDFQECAVSERVGKLMYMGFEWCG